MLIELHNVPIYSFLLITAIPMALTDELGWRFGIGYALVSFIFLGGRILTHSFDLAEIGGRWQKYMATNLVLNTIGCFVIVGLFSVL